MRKQVDKVNRLSAETANAVFESIHTVMHLYRSRQYQSLREGPHELTHMENKVLGFFARHPGATQSDLVAHSGRDKAQLARLIRGLRDMGLLEASADEEDKRSTRLHLSSNGQAVHRQLHEQGSKLSKIAVTGLSEEECNQLVSLLQRVQSNLDSEAK